MPNAVCMNIVDNIGRQSTIVIDFIHNIQFNKDWSFDLEFKFNDESPIIKSTYFLNRQSKMLNIDIDTINFINSTHPFDKCITLDRMFPLDTIFPLNKKNYIEKKYPKDDENKPEKKINKNRKLKTIKHSIDEPLKTPRDDINAPYNQRFNGYKNQSFLLFKEKNEKEVRGENYYASDNEINDILYMLWNSS